MSKARFILVILICAAPVALLWDGLLLQAIIAGIVAVALAITARSLRPGETGFLISVIRPVAAVAAVPVLSVLLQVLPFKALAHPIWTSAESALGYPITSSVSIDPGASIVALGWYLALCAVALLSAAVAIDRARAEWLLFTLTSATVIAALILLTHDWLFVPALSSLARAQAVNCVAMGAIIASAACIRRAERNKARRTESIPQAPIHLRAFAPCGAALAICASALVIEGPRAVLVATGCGLVVLACVVTIRRFALGGWGVVAIAVPALGVAFLVVAAQLSERGSNPLIAFAASPLASPTTVSARALEDAPILGTGAGTFAALAPIYREMDDPAAGSAASTTAATLAIELGRPMLWLIVVSTVSFLVLFLRAALRRGRDSYYPAMGGSCLVTLLLLAFINAGLLGNAAGLIAAVVFGLSTAQSESRTAEI